MKSAPFHSNMKLARGIAFRDGFLTEFEQLKERYGVGQYSWVEGMTRRAARRIARKLARKRVRERW